MRVAATRRIALIGAATVLSVVGLTLGGCNGNARDSRPGASRQELDLAAGAPSPSTGPVSLAIGPLAPEGQTGACFEPLGVRPDMVDPQRLASATHALAIENGATPLWC
jgi:hypothetical protein